MNEFKRTRVSEAVADILSNMHYLRFAFKNDIVNFSALARVIKPVVIERTGDKDVGVDAIIMAIRRYAGFVSKHRMHGDLIELLKSCRVVLRTNEVIVNFRRSPELAAKILDLTKSVNWYAGERMYVIQRSEEICVIASPRFYTELMNIPSNKDDILETIENVSIISIYFDKKVSGTVGVLSFFANQLEMINVSAQVVFSTYDSLSFAVDDKNASKTYEKFTAAINQVKKIF